jgi:uncharacterized protein (TIGR04255 family)
MRVNPFSHESIDEVPLAEAPLVKVLVQLRFPMIAAVETNKGIAGFQAALSERYPVMREDQEFEVAIAGNTPAPVKFNASVVRRFTHPGDPTWTVSLTPAFVALETSHYTNRAEFVGRWHEVLTALTGIEPAPRYYQRLGVRYMNRLVGADVSDHLSDFVHNEILGVTVLADQLGESDELIAAITQANFKVDGVQLTARWGMVPPGGLVAPGLDPIPEVSWILDTDVFVELGETPFDIGEIARITEDAASRAYRFFRWAVKDDFLRQRGGHL